MLVLAACVLALLSPLLRGCSLAALADVRLRGVPLVYGALAIQVVVVYAPLPETLGSVLHVGTYLLAAAFVVRNRAVPGVALVGVGAALNGVTIAANAGTLPASRTAMRAAGLDPDDEGFVNSGVVADPVLPWLGDVFAWPQPLPLANVFSVGDVLIALGVGYGAHRICCRPRTGEPRTSAPGNTHGSGAQGPPSE